MIDAPPPLPLSSYFPGDSTLIARPLPSPVNACFPSIRLRLIYFCIHIFVEMHAAVGSFDSNKLLSKKGETV